MPVGGLVSVPELASEGVARLVGEKPGFWQLQFLRSGAQLTQETHAVVRHCLLPGTQIRVTVRGEDRIGTILPSQISRDRTSGLLVYRAEWTTGGTAQIREDGVREVLEPTEPGEWLATVAFHDLRPIRSGRGGAAPKLEPWGPIAFAARERLLAWRDSVLAATGGVSALASARIVPLPHQVHAARRVLGDREVRFLLADEVGLGKTIEAGLILQSLAALGGAKRVLVVAPGALVSQWFVELHVRFGSRGANVVDGERLRSIDGNPWASGDRFIVSMKALESLDAKASLQFATAKWDVLIIDECHRLQGGSVLAKRLAMASKSTRHVLLLSATPGRSDPDAWLNLLHLLHPTTWRLEDADRIRTRLAHRDALADVARKTAEGAAPSEIVSDWRNILSGDHIAEGYIAALEANDSEARLALLAHVREHHDPERRIVRRTRSDLHRLGSALPGLSLATRELQRKSYTPNADEIAVYDAYIAYAKVCIDQHGTPPRLVHWLLSLHQSMAHPAVMRRLISLRQAVLEDPELADTYSAKVDASEGLIHVIRPDLSEGEVATHLATSAACHADTSENKALEHLFEVTAAWSTRAARKPTARLAALMKELDTFWAERPQEKVLLFTAHALAIEPLRAAFAEAFGEASVATFGAHQDVIQREEAARRFAKERDCTVLICDPLGGEGRNFQFASVVAHHDLPWSVAAIEQRIGRVDRLGRDGVVESLVILPDRPMIESAWGDLVIRATDVFNRPSGGLEFALDAFESDGLLAALTSTKDGIAGAAGITAVADKNIERLQSERKRADKRDDAALAAATSDLESATKLADRLAEIEPPANALSWWIRAQGGKAKREEEAPHAWRIRVPRSETIERGTTERAIALANHDLAFLAPGNDLVDEQLRDAENAQWATATAYRRAGNDHCEAWEGLRAVFVLAPDLSALAKADLPLDAARRLWITLPVRREIIFIHGKDLAVETNDKTLNLLSPPFDHRTGDRAISGSGDREAWTRPWAAGQVDSVVAWQESVRNSLKLAREHGTQAFAAEQAEAAQRLDQELGAIATAARAAATRLTAMLGADHPDTKVASTEADEAERERAALVAAVTGGTIALESAAWIVIAS